MRQINDWFSEAIRGITDANQILSIVQNRNARVQRDIYERFEIRRRPEYRDARDVNTLRLSCRAGRGRPFQGVPRDSSSGRVGRDDQRWINVPEENKVQVHNNIAGSHSINVDDTRTFLEFTVSCRGVAFEDTTRGHGAYDATIEAVFKYVDEAVEALVADDRRALEREVGT